MKKSDYKRLKAMLLAGTIALTSSSLAGCSSRKYEENELIISESTQQYEKRTFNPGEHIISVPINDPTNGIRQYEYHPGYKVVGITSQSLGYFFDGACILYVNEYPVECYSTGIVNSVNLYQNFGSPIDFEIIETKETTNVKEFNPGEHIISVPINDPTNGVEQYEYHAGYEVVGITSQSLGYFFDGACILYVNKEPVACTLTSDNQDLFLSFGVPIENEEVRTR